MAGTATHQIAVLGAVGRGCLTLDAIAAHLPIERQKVSNAAARLVVRGLIERLERGVFQLTAEGSDLLAAGAALRSGPRGPTGAKRPRLDTFRQRAWAAMRMLAGERGAGRFTQDDILILAAREGDTRSNLQRYIAYLLRGGYLVVLPQRVAGTAPNSNGHCLYRLARNTGEIAPVWSHREEAFRDHNTGERVPCRR